MNSNKEACTKNEKCPFFTKGILFSEATGQSTEIYFVRMAKNIRPVNGY